MRGAGCLVVGIALGLALGLVGFGLGLSAFFAAQQETLRGADQAQGFLAGLESSVAWCGLGSLGLLIATGALVILLKELGDETARRERGDLRSTR